MDSLSMNNTREIFFTEDLFVRREYYLRVVRDRVIGYADVEPVLFEFEKKGATVHKHELLSWMLPTDSYVAIYRKGHSIQIHKHIPQNRLKV